MITIPNEYFNKQVLVKLENESTNAAIKANRIAIVNATTCVNADIQDIMAVHFAIQERYKEAFTSIIFHIRGSSVDYPALPDTDDKSRANGTSKTGILDFTLGKTFLIVKHL